MGSCSSKNNVRHTSSSSNSSQQSNPILKDRLPWSSMVMNASSSGETEILRDLLGNVDDVNKIRNQELQKGTSLLHAAAAGSHIDTMQYLLHEQNADPNIRRNRDQQTPLHSAAKGGSPEAIELLLNGEADITATDKEGNTPLHLACEMGKIEAVKTLVQMGGSDVTNIQNKDGCTSFHLAMKKSHGAVAQFMYDQEELVDKTLKDKNDQTALDIARRSKNTILRSICTKEVKKARREGKKASHKRGFPEIPYEQACEAALKSTYRGNLKTLQLIVKHHGTNGLVKMSDAQGLTPLHVASSSGYRNIVTYLLEECQMNPNVASKQGDTPLHVAVLYRRYDVIQTLLQHRADSSKRNQDKQMSPLHQAVELEDFAMVKMLANHRSVLVRDVLGRTSFDMASSASDQKIHDWLHDNFPAKGPSTENAPNTLNTEPPETTDDSTNFSPNEQILKCARNGCLDDLTKLMGESQHLVNINEIKDSGGNTALHAAAMGGHSQVCLILISNYKADPNAINNDGNTPSHLAVRHRRLPVLASLSQRNADLTIRNKVGYTALHEATDGGVLDLVKLLAHANESLVDAQTEQGDTALHLAVRNRYASIAEYLVNTCHANMHLENQQGKTPAELAKYSGDFEIQNLFGCETIAI